MNRRKNRTVLTTTPALFAAPTSIRANIATAKQVTFPVPERRPPREPTC